MIGYKKQNFQNIYRLFYEYRLWCFGYIIGIFFVLFLSSAYYAEIILKSGIPCSMADIYIGSCDLFLWTYAILPADIILFLFWSRDDLLAQPVLLRGSKLKIYVDLVKKIIEIAFIQTILMNIMLVLPGCLFSTEFCNFNSSASAFYLATKQTVEVANWIIVVYFSCIIFIRTTFMLCIGNLMRWCLKQEVFSTILCVCIGTIESVDAKCQLFFGYLTYSYESFASINNIQKSILYMLIFTIVFVVISGIAIKRKEFYYEQPI